MSIIDTNLKGVKEVFRLMLPRSLSLGLGEIENTVTLFFASTLSAGSLSLLNLALQLMYLPSRIFGTTIGQASLPILSKNVAKNQLKTFRNTVSKIILQSLYIALPVTVLILVHRLAIIRILFGSREFPWTATLTTARILAFLTPAIVCQAVIQILIRSFYALHNTRTPFKVSMFSLIANVSTSFYFIKYTELGIIGLAISASVSNFIQMSGLLYFFVRYVDGFNWLEMFKKFNKILVASTIMFFSTWTSLRFLDIFVLDTSKTINLITLFTVSSLFGFFLYLVSSYILKIEEYKDYQKYFFKFTHLLARHK